MSKRVIGMDYTRDSFKRTDFENQLHASNLDGIEKAIMMFYASKVCWGADNWDCFYSNETIAAAIGFSVSVVKKRMVGLRTTGWLKFKKSVGRANSLELGIGYNHDELSDTKREQLKEKTKARRNAPKEQKIRALLADPQVYNTAVDIVEDEHEVAIAEEELRNKEENMTMDSAGAELNISPSATYDPGTSYATTLEAQQAVGMRGISKIGQWTPVENVLSRMGFPLATITEFKLPVPHAALLDAVEIAAEQELTLAAQQEVELEW